MRSIRVRELLLVVALVALGLGWMISCTRLAQVSRKLSRYEAWAFYTQRYVIDMERTLEEERRRLAECEAEREDATDVR